MRWIRHIAAVTLAMGCAVLLRADTRHALPDLPIIVLPVELPRDTMAVVFSGDGGWRDIDRSIAAVFQKQGIPTVGFDSLHYFWRKKSPTQTAADLGRVIGHYSRLWKARHVILVGYSFGADVLPRTYDQLPRQAKSKVSEIALLGLSGRADYEISAGSFFGTGAGDGPTFPDIAKIQPGLVQCFYGEQDYGSACSKLEGTGAEIVRMAGGHHFDGDYNGVANKILDGAKHRIAAHAAYAVAQKRWQRRPHAWCIARVDDVRRGAA